MKIAFKVSIRNAPQNALRIVKKLYMIILWTPSKLILLMNVNHWLCNHWPWKVLRIDLTTFTGPIGEKANGFQTPTRKLPISNKDRCIEKITKDFASVNFIIVTPSVEVSTLSLKYAYFDQFAIIGWYQNSILLLCTVS